MPATRAERLNSKKAKQERFVCALVSSPGKSSWKPNLTMT